MTLDSRNQELAAHHVVKLDYLREQWSLIQEMDDDTQPIPVGLLARFNDAYDACLAAKIPSWTIWREVVSEFKAASP